MAKEDILRSSVREWVLQREARDRQEDTAAASRSSVQGGHLPGTERVPRLVDTFPRIPYPEGLVIPENFVADFFRDPHPKGEVVESGRQYKDGITIETTNATLNAGDQIAKGYLAVLKNAPVEPDLRGSFTPNGVLLCPIFGSVNLQITDSDGKPTRGSGEFREGALLLPPGTHFKIGTDKSQIRKPIAMVLEVPLKKGQYQALQKK